MSRTSSEVNLLDSLGGLVNPATSDNQTNGTQKTKVVNVAGTTINPSTEDKQDDNISKLTDIETNQIDGNQKTQLVDLTGRESLNTVFGEKIIGTRHADIAAQFQYGFPAGTVSADTANGGTITIVESMLTISTSTNVAGAASIRNRKALRYLPGHEAYVIFTTVFTAGVADSYQRAGLRDVDGNAIYLGFNGTDFICARRRDGTDYETIIDLSTFDYAGGTLDATKGNIYRISFGYLGFATIHFEVMTPTGGWTLLSEIQYPNTSTETHIMNTNLQPFLEVGNTGNNTNIVAKSGSFTAGIVDGGGRDPAARRFTFASIAQPITAGTDRIVMFRSKASFSSLTNYISSVLTLLSFNTDLSKSSSWELRKNMTLTNTPTWADVNTTDSTIEYSTDMTVTADTGELVFAVPLGKIDRVLIDNLTEQEIELLPNDTIMLTIKTPGGTSGTYDLSFRWKELF